MKKEQKNLGKLSLNKMKISALQSNAIVGGGAFAASGDGCDSCDTKCNSMNTHFTEIHTCCHTQTAPQR